MLGREENGVYIIDNLSDEYYLKDKDGGIHYVVINELHFSDNDIKVSYTSSSDLESRGLINGLHEMVHKIYVERALLDVENK